jgi:hypothetical protein
MEDLPVVGIGIFVFFALDWGAILGMVMVKMK